MSRLFYHVMQDNLGNLLFDVTGTMRLAGSGTLATIYGDEALTVVLPNPMTNHPSFGSFKCFLGAGDYDFYMAKGGYTFETLTGVQGHGTMAQQDANAVAITGGQVTGLTALGIVGAGNGWSLSLGNPGAGELGGCQLNVSAGTNRWNLYADGTAPNHLTGDVGIGMFPSDGNKLDVLGKVRLNGQIVLGTGLPVDAFSLTTIRYDKTTQNAIKYQPIGSDASTGAAAVFLNTAGTQIGSISTTAGATAFNTSSDVRLKTAFTALTGALDTVTALRPGSFRWKHDDSEGHGFLAHEVAEVVPGVVTGARDAVDDMGQMVPQGIDLSKLVPWLVGSIQELCAQVQGLQAQLDAQAGVDMRA